MIKWILAVFLGFFGGFLLYFELAMVFYGRSSSEPDPLFVLITFFGGWIASTTFLVKRATGVLHILMRGSLLGALLWITMAVSGLIFSGVIAAETIESGTGGTAEVAGAAIGGGLAAFLTGTVSIAMAIASLIAFAVFWLIDRDRKAKLS